MPGTARLATGSLDTVPVAIAKFVGPPPDRLMTDDHTALEQQFLDVAKTALEAEIPANSEADDRRGKPATVVERIRLLHRVVLSHGFANVTLPAGPPGCARRAVCGSRTTVATSGPRLRSVLRHTLSVPRRDDDAES